MDYFFGLITTDHSGPEVPFADSPAVSRGS